MAEWYIEPAGTSRRGESATKLKSELDDFEVLIREVVQNSLDAGLSDDEPVHVHFRFQELRDESKAEFLAALNGEKYRAEMELAYKYEKYRQDEQRTSRARPLQIDENALRVFDPQDETPLRILTISDYHTTGLTGEEFDYGEASRFCACCRDTAFSVKGTKRSGGSYGRGKNALWRHASTGLVLFSSELSEPHQEETSRFIGSGRLPWHADWETRDRESRKNGVCYFGSDTNGKSILGHKAQELSRRLLLKREQQQFGTSIGIVGFNPKGVLAEKFERENFSHTELMDVIQSAVGTWYWPAILENKLRVFVHYPNIDVPVEVNVNTRDDLEPYMLAWMVCEEDKKLRKVLSIKVPKGPLDEEPEVTSEFRVGVERLDEEISAEDPPLRSPGSERVALVRGFGMVVNYRPVTPKRISRTPYVGVCRAGLAIPDADRSQNSPAERLEVLLSSSEPPAHDRWRPEEIDTNTWYGAQSRVRDVLRQIQVAVNQLAGDLPQQKEEDGLPELSKRFRFPADGPVVRENKISISSHKSPQLIDSQTLEFAMRFDFLNDEKNLSRESGKLIVQLVVEATDPSAGPGYKSGEGFPVLLVEVKDQEIDVGRVPRAKENSPKRMFSIRLEETPLPIVVKARAIIPRHLQFDDASYGLKLKAAYQKH